MLISICFTSRPSGVLSIRNITKLNVFMLIIGKTLGGSLISSITTAISFVKIGSQVHSSLNTMRDASSKHHANIAMDGKSKSITRCTTRLCLAKMRSLTVNKLRSVLEALNVPTTTH
jgi:hypothetical protein